MMANTMTKPATTAGQEDEAISPYLRRPLRSLRGYLLERAQSRSRSGETTPTRSDHERVGKRQDGSSGQDGGQG